MKPFFAQSALPPAEAIRNTADEVISRPHYELGLSPRPDVPPLWLELLRWLIRPFEWLFDATEGWPDFLRWIVVVVLLVILVALVAHIVYTLAAAIRGPLARRRPGYTPARQEVDPHALERKAESFGATGNYIEAIRLLFRAALRRIELAENKKFRPGCTNRELLRRYRATPLFESLARFVETIDLKWYRGESCDQSDYLACRGEHAKIQQHTRAAG